jgi:hypothetical protein
MTKVFLFLPSKTQLLTLPLTLAAPALAIPPLFRTPFVNFEFVHLFVFCQPQELTALAPSEMKIEVVSPPKRMHSAWAGGSIFAMRIPESGWMTMSDYDKEGPCVVHRKCGLLACAHT